MSRDALRSSVSITPRDSALLRASTTLPYVLLAAQVLLTARALRPGVVAVLLAISAVVGIGMLRELRRGVAIEVQGGRIRGGWQLFSVFGSTAMLPFALVAAADVNVVAFSAVVALILLNVGFLLERQLRVPSTLWVPAGLVTVLWWAVTLWWSGLRTPALLAAHVGAALAVLAIAAGTSGLLVRVGLRESRARLQADSTATLLETLLGTRSLEVPEVAAAAAASVQFRGFNPVVVRLLDRRAGVARPLAAVGEPLARVRARDLTSPALAVLLTTGAIQRHPRPDGVVEVLLPLRERGQTVAVVEAVSRRSADLDERIASLHPVIRRAEGAMVRARAFERDRHDVRELQWLEQRTNDLISTVSHELRTPMTVISGLGETLQSRWRDLDPEVRIRLLDRIAANATRLDTIVGSLLDSGALEEGQLRAQPEPTDLRALLDALLDRLELVTAGRRVEVRVDDAIVVHADPALIPHVFENLLVNVANHTPPDTVVVIEADVVTDADGSPGRVEVTLTDDGPGISEHDRAHIFDRFYRGGDPDRRSSGGIGLGLPLARQIVRAHGGELTVEPLSDTAGTRFRFSLPVARSLPVSRTERPSGH